MELIDQALLVTLGAGAMVLVASLVGVVFLLATGMDPWEKD